MIKYTYFENHHKRNGRAENAQPHPLDKIIERIDLILDTHSTECTHQSIDISNAFR